MSHKQIMYTLVVIGLVLSLVAAACAAVSAPASTGGQAAAGEEKISILIWDQFTAPEWEATMTGILDRFRAAHPNVEITREAVTREQQLQTAKTAIASGTGPDLIYMDAGPGNAGTLIDAGLLLPLDDLAGSYGWKERFFPWAQRLASQEGKLYGLSLEMEFLGVYVNRTLMEKEGLQVPTTDAEVLAFCAQAKEKGYIPFAWSNNPGWQSFHQFGMITNNAVGAKGMEELLFENKGTWTRPEFVNAVNFFFIEMHKAGCFVDEPNALEYNDANALFYSGKALLNPTGTWMIDGITENMQDYTVELVPFPSIQGGERVLPGGLGSAWFISAKSQHPETIAMLLDFMYTDESVQAWVEGVAAVPPLPFDASNWNVSPLLKFAISTAQAGGKGEAGSNLGQYIDTNTPDSFNEMMQDGFQAVVAGLKTPDEQLADLQKEWDANWKPR